MQLPDSENVQRNLKIVQIPRLRRIYINAYIILVPVSVLQASMSVHGAIGAHNPCARGVYEHPYHITINIDQNNVIMVIKCNLD